MSYAPARVGNAPLSSGASASAARLCCLATRLFRDATACELGCRGRSCAAPSLWLGRRPGAALGTPLAAVAAAHRSSPAAPQSEPAGLPGARDGGVGAQGDRGDSRSRSQRPPRTQSNKVERSSETDKRRPTESVHNADGSAVDHRKHNPSSAAPGAVEAQSSGVRAKGFTSHGALRKAAHTSHSTRAASDGQGAAAASAPASASAVAAATGAATGSPATGKGDGAAPGATGAVDGGKGSVAQVSAQVDGANGRVARSGAHAPRRPGGDPPRERGGSVSASVGASRNLDSAGSTQRSTLNPNAGPSAGGHGPLRRARKDVPANSNGSDAEVGTHGGSGSSVGGGRRAEIDASAGPDVQAAPGLGGAMPARRMSAGAPVLGRTSSASPAGKHAFPAAPWRAAAGPPKPPATPSPGLVKVANSAAVASSAGAADHAPPGGGLASAQAPTTRGSRPARRMLDTEPPKKHIRAGSSPAAAVEGNEAPAVAAASSSDGTARQRAARTPIGWSSGKPRAPQRSSHAPHPPPGGNQERSWRHRPDVVDFAVLYPSVESFAAGVKANAQEWPPVVVCAAMNHLVKLWSDKRKGDGGGQDAGRLRVRGAAVGAQGSSEQLLRQAMADLQAVYRHDLPHAVTARYPINALWVCAKTGLWHPQASSGHSADTATASAPAADADRARSSASTESFPAAAIACLRANNYRLLRNATGQSHGILWWALSEYRQQLEDVPQGRSPAVWSTAEAADVLAVSAEAVKSGPLDFDDYKTQELCNIVLGAARLGYSSDTAFIDHVLDHFVRHPGPCKPQAVANVAYALGELYGSAASTDDDLKEQEEAEAAAEEDGRERAKWEAPPDSDSEDGGPPLGAEPASVDSSRPGPSLAADLVSGATADDDASSTAADSSSGVQPTWAIHMGKLAQMALEIGLENFKPQEMSNMLYACARLGLRMPSSLNPARPPLVRRDVPAERSRQHARGLITTRQFVDRIARHLAERLEALHDGHAFGTQALSNAAWALARMNYNALPFYEQAMHAVVRCKLLAYTTKPQEVSNFLWALATARHQPPPAVIEALLNASCLKGHLSWNVSDSTQSWSNVLWAVSVLGVYDEDLLRRMAVMASAPGFHIPCSQVTAALWSLVAMPHGVMARHADLQGILVGFVNRCDPRAFCRSAYVQVWQAHIEIEAAIAEAAASGTGTDAPMLKRLNPDIVAAARRALLDVKMGGPKFQTTALQLDVAGCAIFLMVTARAEAKLDARRRGRQQRGAAADPPVDPAASLDPGVSTAATQPDVSIVRIEQEWLVEPIGVFVDIYVWLSNGRQVVVEVDGPAHYMSSPPHMKLPRAELRDRQLARVLGADNVVVVPYFEWDACEGQEGKRSHLSRLLGLSR